MTLTIATTIQLPDPALALLGEVGIVHGPVDWRGCLESAHGLVSVVAIGIDEEFLRGAPSLKIVANAGVGFDNIDVEACRKRGVIVTNTPDVLTDATADIAMALILAAVRQLTREEARLRAGLFDGWKFWENLGGDVGGSRLGIFGMGRIGQAVARRALPFGMSVIYHGRSRLAPDVERELNATWVSWETLLADSDVLSLHAPYTTATHHIVDAAALRRMKPGSHLVNTARGPLVDEAALVDALRDGPLAGAGLDVYEREPIVHPGLLELSNVTLLPHIGSATPATRTAMALLAARNVYAVLSGAPPLTPVISRPPA
jgi:glyoxylate reductase